MRRDLHVAVESECGTRSRASSRPTTKKSCDETARRRQGRTPRDCRPGRESRKAVVLPFGRVLDVPGMHAGLPQILGLPALLGESHAVGDRALLELPNRPTPLAPSRCSWKWFVDGLQRGRERVQRPHAYSDGARLPGLADLHGPRHAAVQPGRAGPVPQPELLASAVPLMMEALEVLIEVAEPHTASNRACASLSRPWCRSPTPARRERRQRHARRAQTIGHAQDVPVSFKMMLEMQDLNTWDVANCEDDSSRRQLGEPPRRVGGPLSYPGRSRQQQLGRYSPPPASAGQRPCAARPWALSTSLPSTRYRNSRRITSDTGFSHPGLCRVVALAHSSHSETQKQVKTRTDVLRRFSDNKYSRALQPSSMRDNEPTRTTTQRIRGTSDIATPQVYAKTKANTRKAKTFELNLNEHFAFNDLLPFQNSLFAPTLLASMVVPKAVFLQQELLSALISMQSTLMIDVTLTTC
ncbi:hypothetical protein ON010_g8699 [Phytophthora cinnamomi]|nr:hypothetical protein ON010_g8699 [Phytophthora cinnamomi]